MDRIRAAREARGWSQAELAERAGVTRQLVGAVEGGRHAPSVDAAIGLARALGTSVEALFAPPGADGCELLGDRSPAPGTPLQTVRVGDRLVGVPLRHAVAPAEGWGVADAVASHTGIEPLPAAATDGLVVAGCDPLLGLHAGLVTRATSDRVVVAHASTGRAVEALAAERVHGVVVHARAGHLPDPPVPVRRWHLARWQVGLAGSGRSGPPTLEEVAARRLRVVQRDPGAGSQRAFERALAAIGGSSVPGPVGEGHLDVARRVAHGGGRAGVTMEAAARAFELAFAPLEAHEVELWIDRRWSELPAARAFVDHLDRPELIRRAALLGGYDLAECGSARD